MDKSSILCTRNSKGIMEYLDREAQTKKTSEQGELAPTWWGKVDSASRGLKNMPQACFLRPAVRTSCSNPAPNEKQEICHTASLLFWWGKVDSNHRRHSQQIYSLSPLATREFPHIQLCKSGLPGAGRRTRTPGLLITNQLLYQLSYTSISRA